MSTSPPHTPLCFRVFGIPELASSIVTKVLSGSDWVSLLCVCRQFFENIRPVAWSTVFDANALILLIPGADVVPRDGLGELHTTREITAFPENFDLSRFELYASCVRNLWLPIVWKADANSNWSKFLTHTSASSMFPNLKQIIMSPDVYVEHVAQPVDQESVKLLTAFLSPSMTSLRIMGQKREYVEFKHFHIILEHLAERCPGLESLGVQPGDKQNVDISKFHPTNPGSHNSPERFISRLACLRTLTTTSFVLENQLFMALSQLPQLENLNVLCDLFNDIVTYGTDIDLPSVAFPSLRAADLTSFSLTSAANICCLQPFMSNLNVLRLAISRPLHEMGGTAELPDILDLFTPITSFGSHIAKLTITGGDPWIITPEAIRLLESLPLSTLYLGDIDYNTFDLETLVHTLPGLEELRLSSAGRSAPLGHLHTIACSLLSLRHLSLFINFETLGDIAHEKLEAPNPRSLLPVCFESDFYPHQPRPEASKAIATYLYCLWPQVECVQAGDEEAYRGFSEYFIPGHFGDSRLRERVGISSNLETINTRLRGLEFGRQLLLRVYQ